MAKIPFSSIYPGKSSRNHVIGGGFNFWQRGTSFSGTLTTYTADRWFSFRQGAVTGISASRQLTGFAAGPKYCFRLQRTAGNATTNALELITAFETINSTPLQGKKVTLSFWARAGANFSSAGNSLTSYIATGEGTDQGVVSAWTNPQTFSQNQAITTSWVRYTLQATIPASAAQIRIDFNYIPVGTAGANDYVEVAGVMLTEGTDAPADFELAGITEALEEALCHRYYLRMDSAMLNEYSTNPNAPGYHGFANVNNTWQITGGNFPVVMRVRPVTNWSSTAHFGGHIGGVISGALNIIAGGSIGGISANRASWSAYGGITNTTLRPFEFYMVDTVNAWLSFDAEL